MRLVTHGPRLITRRAALLGAACSAGALGLACGASASARSTRIIGASRDGHFTSALFGRPAGARLLKRATGYVPPNRLVPFFRDWQTGLVGAPWPSATARASETEIYADLSGEKLAIFRGMPAGAEGPSARVWRERGRTAAGVWAFHASPFDYYRLFILPDGTWIAGYGPKALRCAGRIGDGVILQFADPALIKWCLGFRWSSNLR